MRLSKLATASFYAGLASARIIGISAPSSLAPNTTFPLTLLTEGYIQSVADIAVAYGFQLPTTAYPNGFPGTLGAYVNSSYIGPQNSNTQSNVTINATVPVRLEDGNWYGKNLVLTAGVYSIYGASGDTGVYGWKVTVTIGETTGGDMVTSTEMAWAKSMLSQ